MTRRSWITLGVFAACLFVLLGGMAGLSATLLAFAGREEAARRQAVEEENVRLALWRMDSSIAPMIAREGARPYFMYSAFYPAERAYTQMVAEPEADEVLVASPLLAESPERTLLHFRVDPTGRITSPQAPEGRLAELARGHADKAQIESGQVRLAELRRLLTHAALAELLPRDGGAGEAEVREQLAANQARPPSQAARSSVEWLMRSKSVDQASNYKGNTYNPTVVRTAPEGAVGANAETLTYGNITEGPVTPLWIDGSLFLVRRLEIAGAEYFQGCWLDWPSIREWLLEDIRDLLPEARLLPAAAAGSPAETRRLASLPVRVIAGAIPLPAAADAFPVGLVLGVAWVGVLLAAGAVAALLFGTIALSERRATFVSSVTHELRTPLTTFRMYSEMLAEGMVKDEEKQRSYLETLKREAVRLSHLVENVLAYARIERGRHTGRIETLDAGSAIERMRDRLADRAAQAGMSLVLDPPAGALRVVADATALEQILFNLVDNACKYAASAQDRTIRAGVHAHGAEVLFRVRDHGPGIPAAERRRLFSPFSKSAQRAALTAPGVGLGLALSRRLARTMGGDLRLEDTRDGASFALTLPAAR